MESAPKISQDNTEKPKDTLWDKVKRGVKIGAIATVGFTTPLSNQETPEIHFPPENKLEWSNSELEGDDDLEKIATYFAHKTKEEEMSILEENIISNEEYLQDIDKKLNSNSISSEEREEFEWEKKYVTQSIENIKKELGAWYSDKKEVKDSVFSELVKDKIRRIEAFIEDYDEGRNWVLENLKNPEYKKRLENEYRSDPNFYSENRKKELKNLTEFLFSERKKQAQDSDYKLSLDIDASYSKGSQEEHSHGSIGAFYSTKENDVVFPVEKDNFYSRVQISIHEYAHKITEGNLKMSNKSLELFSEAFDTASVASNINKLNPETFLEDIYYYSDPTEMYARKKVFDYDLERFGIKKYEEKFTKEHYQKALKILREQRLSPGGEQFMYMIKPKMMEKVMNEIAENKLAIQEDNQNLA